MGFIDRLLSPFKPPERMDPDFGRLLYMHIARDPAKSYWEAEWLFPPTGTRIAIGLPGTKEGGPLPEARVFYLATVPRFAEILARVRPALDRVFTRWLSRPLPADLWSELKLAGIGLEDPRTTPMEWDVSFETTGTKWLGITVPFVGEEPGDAVVDT
jgi:hypothetical protein